MSADRGIGFASCDGSGVALAGQGVSDPFHLADGVFDAPPGMYEFVAAVDDARRFLWGHGFEVSGTRSLLRMDGTTVWIASEAGQLDTGCGPIPSQVELTPETGSASSCVAAAFDPSGACLWSHRLVQQAGLPEATIETTIGDGAGGIVVLWANGSPGSQSYYDAALEHYDAEGNSLWATDVFPKFGNSMIGSLARSEADGSYYAGRMLGESHDAVVTKVSKDGEVLWTKTVATWEYGRMWGFAPDAGGGLLISGRFEHIDGDGKAQICGKTFDTQGRGDGFAARLDDDGNCTWVRLFATPGFDQANAIAASRSDGAVVVAWEDWPDDQWEADAPLVNMHITKFVPELGAL